jgi:hypothetical protein
MFRNIVEFEHTVEGFTGLFHLPNGTPVHLAKEMLVQFLKMVALIEDQAKTQEIKDEDQEEKAEA